MQIKTLLQRLAQHHSAGPLFNAQVIRRWTVGKMAKAMKAPKPPAWKCYPCKRVVTGLEQWCPLCEQHWTYCADPNFTQPQPKAPAPKPQVQREVEWKGEHWFWPPDKQRRPSRSASRREKARLKKEAAAQGKGPMGHGDAASGSSPFASSTKSPFSGVSTYALQEAAAPWPPKEQPTKPSKTGVAPTDSSSAEWIDAVKRSYPDLSQMPESLKLMLHKHEASLIKTMAQRMGETSGTLDEMQEQLKALKFSKAQHRQAWIKNMQETMESWQDHCKAYQEQQEEFSRLISNITTEIASTTAAWESLSRQAGENLPKVETLDDAAAEATAEKGEKEIRKKVLSTFKTCLAMANAAPTQVDSDSSHEEDTEIGRVTKIKRTREEGPKANATEDATKSS